MTRILKYIGALGLAAFLAFPAYADDTKIEDRVLGKADAPVTVEEYISLTCPHCAEFYDTTLPQLEKAYVDTGKVKFILRDFPIDGIALKAATLARCMPADEFYPFISVLYQNQKAWALAEDPQSVLIQYATLGGLGRDKAKECLANTTLENAVIAERTDATSKYNIAATPTFVINNGAETIQGARTVEEFSAAFDRQLAVKH